MRFIIVYRIIVPMVLIVDSIVHPGVNEVVYHIFAWFYKHVLIIGVPNGRFKFCTPLVCNLPYHSGRLSDSSFKES